MNDVCWIHNMKYRFGEKCPDCLDREQERKKSFPEEPVSARKREPGDRMWDVVTWLVMANVVLWVVVIVGSIIMTGGR